MHPPAATRRNLFAFAGRILSIVAVIALAVAGSVTTAAANSKYAGIVVDAKTGAVLYENDADAPRYPASLTKMMTLYLTFEALKAGKVSLDTRIPVSAHAASEPPTKLGLRAGSTIRVEDVIKALITLSANDAATAMGEFLGGSEANFGLIMTNKARALGMSRTTFRNANGLPDPKQVTTARDLSRLAIALREHFPNYYHYFSLQSFRYGKRLIRGHNHLLGHVEGVDGLKTGYTNASGYNLATSVRRNGRSIVGIVMGGRTWASRDAQMRELIAKYMPQASRSGDGDLIARTRMAPTLAAVDLPPHGPRPEFRKPSARPVALAYANDAEATDFPMPAPRPIVGRAALAETLQAQQQALASASAPSAPRPAVPVPGAQASTLAPRPGAPIGGTRVDDITTASTTDAPTTGWVIQIGATPDKASALRLLEKAKASNGKLLASAEPFTVLYGDDGDRMYRARFGGFKGKDSAWAACSRLKRSGYGCWATEQ